jgi:hypothetical protein
MAQAQLCASAFYIKSQRGANKLAFNGYLYYKESAKGSRVYWRCEDRSCRGRVVETEGCHQEIQDHFHPPDASKVQVS